MKLTTMYVIKSVSEEGTYYLVNGWRKNRKLWEKKISEITYFKTEASAKASLTKLLKVMDDYRNDEFSIMAIGIMN